LETTSGPDPSISVVIVAYQSAPDLARTLPALIVELRDGDELIVINNSPGDGLEDALADLLAGARVERLENPGFAAAANRGAAVATGDVVVILNPDAKPEPGWGEAIRRPHVHCPEWTAWMGLVTCMEVGERCINSFGNPIHFTGLVWAGGHGLPLSEAGRAREVPTASGACLAMRREDWLSFGGFPEHYFLYHEDVDLSVRIRSRGGAIGIEPSALVDHDYEFAGGSAKWRWLERNRWAMNIRNFPGSLLLLLAPALLATEIAILFAAARGGWLGQKLASWGDLLRWFPRLLRERRDLARQRTISSAEFAAVLTSRIDSPFLPASVRSGLLAGVVDSYWRLVKAVLRRATG
jgi:GT2 family glycosyltransferase